MWQIYDSGNFIHLQPFLNRGIIDIYIYIHILLTYTNYTKWSSSTSVYQKTAIFFVMLNKAKV